MKTVGLIFGGPGNEHEVSISSAKNIAKNFDFKKYKLALIFWDKRGFFYLLKDIHRLGAGKKKINCEDFKKLFDIALLMTHGRFGEDGVLQGMLEAQRIKYCGCRVLSSALCMDKGLFKQYLAGQKINQVKFAVLDYARESDQEIKLKIARIKKDFKLPLYIKPANSGSSVGITRIEKFSQLDRAIKDALPHDSKIIIEEGLINPKEIEMAILGNKELIVSRPGELRLVKDFYSYDDKYKLGQTKVIIPAGISPKQSLKLSSLAEKVYRLCDCSGFARLDFFIVNNKIYLNEINTLPGFTDISMYPMLMLDRGLSYQELINRIIGLAY